MDKEIVVPQGMLSAAWNAVGERMRECVNEGKGDRLAELHVARIAVTAALKWLSENPIVPTSSEITGDVVISSGNRMTDIIYHVVAFQRRMFFRDACPEEIKDLLDHLDRDNDYLLNQRVIEAFNRGRKLNH